MLLCNFRLQTLNLIFIIWVGIAFNFFENIADSNDEKHVSNILECLSESYFVLGKLQLSLIMVLLVVYKTASGHLTRGMYLHSNLEVEMSKLRCILIIDANTQAAY